MSSFIPNHNVLYFSYAFSPISISVHRHALLITHFTLQAYYESISKWQNFSLSKHNKTEPPEDLGLLLIVSNNAQRCNTLLHSVTTLAYSVLYYTCHYTPYTTHVHLTAR